MGTIPPDKNYEVFTIDPPEFCKEDIPEIYKEETHTFGRGEEDSHGIAQHETGSKLDKGKPDASLLLMFGKALRAVSEVGTFGAVKYTRGGWQDVPDGENRYTAALLRHLLKEHYEEFDQDLPVLHAAQVTWNALARLELILRRKEKKNEKNKD
jgi:hypothetical protein